MNRILNQDRFIQFVEDTHQYFDPNGNEYKSVTRVIGSFHEKFDRDNISLAMAKNLAKENNTSIDFERNKLLQEWEDKRKSAEDRGNWIHSNLENYILTGKCDPKLDNVVFQLKELYNYAYRYFPELIIYSSEHRIAGMSDLVVQRQKTIKNYPIIDFFDYKTNESNGIQFNTIREKNNKLTHYNRFMFSPVEHLEDCNYNHYALQLSIYAYMAEITWRIIVGRLAILFIDLELNLHIYPVPYMRYEAKAILDNYKSLKPLPQPKVDLKNDKNDQNYKKSDPILVENDTINVSNDPDNIDW